MGERKVVNKYYPPDFDPNLLPRATRPKNGQYVVRTMANFSMRCKTCGNYIYKGTKFNARHEFVQGEAYMGIAIRRFYIKCTRCSAEITWKTDPQNSDYTMEYGAIRTTDGLKIGQKMLAAFKAEREASEAGDVVKTVVNKTLDNKMEMEILDALDEVRTLNAKVSKMDPLAVLEMRKAQWEEEDAEGETLIDPEEELVLQELREMEERRELKDAVKRLEEDHKDDERKASDPMRTDDDGALKLEADDDEEDDFDPAHPSLFAPMVPKKEDEASRDAEGFALPKPIRVKKSAKDPSPVLSVQLGIPGKHKVAVKFQPRFRRTALVHDEAKFLEDREQKAKERRDDEKLEEEAKMETIEEGVQVASGFSLVDYS